MIVECWKEDGSLVCGARGTQKAAGAGGLRVEVEVELLSYTLRYRDDRGEKIR